jgi:hypothetical protein
VEQVCEQQKQRQRQDGAPPRQREGKQKVATEDDKDEEMEFQNAKRALKTVYDHFDSDSSTNDRRNTLHVMYGGSWDITSQRVVKTLHWVVAATVPAPKPAPHHKWMETTIGYDASDCPKNMVRAG